MTVREQNGADEGLDAAFAFLDIGEEEIGLSPGDDFVSLVERVNWAARGLPP